MFPLEVVTLPTQLLESFAWDSGILAPGDHFKWSVGSQRILELSRVLGEGFSGASMLG